MRERSPIQFVALLVGALFLLVGIAGFIPGLTTNLDELELAGRESGAELLGLFQTSVLLNLVHLLSGVIGLVMARTWAGSRIFLVGGGQIYLVLWIYGLAIDKDTSANFVPFDTAGDWLHYLFGIGTTALGIALGRSGSRERAVVRRRA